MKRLQLFYDDDCMFGQRQPLRRWLDIFPLAVLPLLALLLDKWLPLLRAMDVGVRHQLGRTRRPRSGVFMDTLFQDRDGSSSRPIYLCFRVNVDHLAPIGQPFGDGSESHRALDTMRRQSGACVARTKRKNLEVVNRLIAKC